MCGASERSHHVFHVVALAEPAEFPGRESHFLHHERYGAPAGVGVGYGERHPLTVFVHSDYHEVAGLSAFSYERRFDFEFEYFF